MHKNFRLLFYLKKPKDYTLGNVPIYLRITVDGKRAEVSTQRQCDPERWNSQAGRMAGTKEDARAMNIYLDTLQAKIYEFHREILLSGLPLTAETIKIKFTGQGERPRMLMEIFEHHNQQFAELVGIEYSEGTLKKFKSVVTSLREFLKWKFQVADINIKELGFEFVNDYEFYLKSIQGVQQG